MNTCLKPDVGVEKIACIFSGLEDLIVLGPIRDLESFTVHYDGKREVDTACWAIPQSSSENKGMRKGGKENAKRRIHWIGKECGFGHITQILCAWMRNSAAKWEYALPDRAVGQLRFQMVGLSPEGLGQEDAAPASRPWSRVGSWEFAFLRELPNNAGAGGLWVREGSEPPRAVQTVSGSCSMLLSRV